MNKDLWLIAAGIGFTIGAAVVAFKTLSAKKKTPIIKKISITVNTNNDEIDSIKTIINMIDGRLDQLEMGVDNLILEKEEEDAKIKLKNEVSEEEVEAEGKLMDKLVFDEVIPPTTEEEVTSLLKIPDQR